MLGNSRRKSRPRPRTGTRRRSPPPRSAPLSHQVTPTATVSVRDNSPAIHQLFPERGCGGTACGRAGARTTGSAGSNRVVPKVMGLFMPHSACAPQHRHASEMAWPVVDPRQKSVKSIATGRFGSRAFEPKWAQLQLIFVNDAGNQLPAIATLEHISIELVAVHQCRRFSTFEERQIFAAGANRCHRCKLRWKHPWHKLSAHMISFRSTCFEARLRGTTKGPNHELNSN